LDRPNILLIVMDTQRADNLSCYGYSKETTPNIDRIAKDGAVFLNNITPGVWTLPSHASLFTGRYVSGHGADAHCEYLMAEFPTMAEVLRELGYHTVGFSNNGWVSRRTGVARGFEEFYLIGRGARGRRVVEWFYVAEEVPEEEGDRGSLKTVNAAMAWLDSKWDRRRPFFMFINFIEPHGPYWPPEPFRSKFLPPNVSEEELRRLPKLRSTVECVDVRVEALKLSEREWELEKALYDGCTATVDDRVGRLYSYLREEGLLDDTLLIITSDHGDVQGEHEPHVEHHLCAYEELVRVPLIMRYTDAIPRGIRVRWLSQTLDIFPTILDLLEVRERKYWRTLQGYSLMPSLLEDTPVREYALVEYHTSVQQMFHVWRRHPRYDIRRFNYWLKALRTLRYKDPGETRNLASERPDLVEDLRNRLEQVLLSIDQVYYGDIQREQHRMLQYGEVAAVTFKRLRAWGFYREVREAKLLVKEDVII